MRSKIAAILLMAVMSVFFFVGCGGDSDSGSGNNVTVENGETKSEKGTINRDAEFVQWVYPYDIEDPRWGKYKIAYDSSNVSLTEFQFASEYSHDTQIRLNTEDYKAVKIYSAWSGNSYNDAVIFADNTTIEEVDQYDVNGYIYKEYRVETAKGVVSRVIYVNVGENEGFHAHLEGNWDDYSIKEFVETYFYVVGPVE